MTHGYTYLRNSKVPIPESVAGLFPHYSLMAARISYWAEWGVPTKLFFTIDVEFVSVNQRRSLPNLLVFSLDGVVDRDESSIGGGCEKIVGAAKDLLADRNRMAGILFSYLSSGQPQRSQSSLTL